MIKAGEIGCLKYLLATSLGFVSCEVLSSDRLTAHDILPSHSIIRTRPLYDQERCEKTDQIRYQNHDAGCVDFEIDNSDTVEHRIAILTSM